MTISGVAVGLYKFYLPWFLRIVGCFIKYYCWVPFFIIGMASIQRLNYFDFSIE